MRNLLLLAAFILQNCIGVATADVTIPSASKDIYTHYDFNRFSLYLLTGIYLADGSSNTSFFGPASNLSDDNSVFRLPDGNGTSGYFLITDGSGNTSWDSEGILTTKGDIWTTNGTNGVRRSVGSDGEVLQSDSTDPTGLSWTTALTNPMTTQGDVIVGGSSGTPGRLACPTDNRVLRGNGTTVICDQIDDPGFFTTGAEVTQSAPGVVESAGQLIGTNTNDNASAGNVGEYLDDNLDTDTTATCGGYTNVASVSLTAGDWDLAGLCVANAGGTGVTRYLAAISSTSTGANETTIGGLGTVHQPSGAATLTNINSGTQRRSVSTTTTIYLNCFVDCSTAFDWDTRSYLSARRVR